MDWIKTAQEIVPWLTSLPIPQKVIASTVIIAGVALLLVIIWTPAPDKAVATILADCHRRALFTRMHAQMNVEAMFSSIGKCRESLQAQIAKIQNKGLQEEAIELLAAVEGIERLKGQPNPDKINKFKLAALHSFRKLSDATGINYPLPTGGRLAEGVYFTQAEADAPLDIADLKSQISIDPTTGAAGQQFRLQPASCNELGPG
jgi:hypothetical protein